MDGSSIILRDIERSSLDWKLVCPKCGSFVSAKYALALAPILGVTILPYFYCHCTRFQVMEPQPSQLTFHRIVIILYTFTTVLLASMVNYILHKSGKWTHRG